jgi:hypothetical protein
VHRVCPVNPAATAEQGAAHFGLFIGQNDTGAAARGGERCGQTCRTCAYHKHIGVLIQVVVFVNIGY